jgi:hypothetical protein
MYPGPGKTAGCAYALSVEALSTTLVPFGSRHENPRFFFALHKAGSKHALCPFLCSNDKESKRSYLNGTVSMLITSI